MKQKNIRKESAGTQNRPLIMSGMHLKLFTLFFSLALGVLTTVGIQQMISVRSAFYEMTRNQLGEVGRSISATYGSSAFLNSIRSALFSKQYSVRVIDDQGTILTDPGQLSVYQSWPGLDLTASDMTARLDVSDGSYYITASDETGQSWLVYVQLLGLREGRKEILLAASDLSSVQARIRDLICHLLAIGGVLLAVSLVVSDLMTRYFMSPLDQVIRQAERVSYGDYDVNFPENSYAEINTLSRALNQAVEQFQEYESYRRELISNVSHDMRTPLTMIRAYAEMIQNISGDDPEKRNAHLDVIISQADHLSDFVNASLNLSRLQSGKAELHYEVFELSDLVAVRVEDYRSIYPEMDIEMHTDPGSLIRADLSMIERLMDNLVSNAVKYGASPICVNVINKGDLVELQVADHGKGIPENMRHMVWNRYYRINPDDKSRSAGVGLSIVQEIAKLHGIEYGLDCIEDQSPLFWFRFPVFRA